MATITRKVPWGDVAVFKATFSTQEELLDIDFVKNYRLTENGKNDKYFHRYSLNGNSLVVECNGGNNWFYIGDIDDTSMLNLPHLGDNEED